MSHEVLITRRQSIFDFFANPGRGGPQKAGASWCWLPGMLRPASAWICKKIKNALSSGYQVLMGHLILTTSPWSILTWITLLYSISSVANKQTIQIKVLAPFQPISILSWEEKGHKPSLKSFCSSCGSSQLGLDSSLGYIHLETVYQVSCQK